MSKANRVAGLLATAAAVTMLVGCSSGQEGGSDASPVVIGVAIPQTGPAAADGRDAQEGADLAAAEVNASEGKCLDGRSVKLVYEDDKSTPDGGVTAVQKLMSQDGAKAITGGVNSSTVLAEVSVSKNRILQVNAAAQADAITADAGKYFFQINNTTSKNLQYFDQYLTQTIKPTKVAYIGEDTAFNTGVLEVLEKDLAAANVKITSEAKYQTDTTDFSAILRRALADKPDLLYVADASPTRSATMMQQLKQLGGIGQVVFSPGVMTQEYAKLGGANMDGAISGDIYSASETSAANQEFVKDFEDKYSRTPGKVELTHYEAVKAICAAMTSAKSDSDYDAIAAAMSGLKLDTPRGVLSFGDKGRARATAFYIQQAKDGVLGVIDSVPMS